MAKLLTSKSTVLVYEQGLSTGSGELSDGDASNNSDIREAGIRTLSSTGGTGPYTYSLISSAVGTYGTLSLDSATGIYTYILATRYDTSPDADNGLNTEVAGDTFSYMVTDATGQSATATIRVNVVDDVPTARPNTSSATGVETVSGNVLSDGVDDSFGADGPTVAGGGVVGIARGSSTTAPVTGGLGATGIAGDYGTLMLNADGSYSYTGNGTVPAGSSVVDHFVYTIKDGDGDTSTTTLDITVSGTSPGPGGVYDVRLYGATGNDVTDDTSAIQAAINAAHAAGGGVVFIAAGTYMVSGTADKSDGAIRLLDNVTLQGEGMGLTILKVIDNNPYAITGVVRTPYNEITHDVAMYDLTIDGNRANNVNKIDGFYSGVAPGDTRQDYNITIERVEVMNMTGYGFDPHEQTVNLRIADSVAHHNGLDGFVADFLIDSVFENNLAYANDRHGFNVTTSTTGLLLLNNVAHDNGSAGLIIQRSGEDITAPNHITVEGGAYYNNVREGIYIKIAEDVTILGVDVYGNDRQGIRIDGSTNVLIDGATVFNNSQAAAGIYDEIRIGRYNDTTGSSGLFFDTTGVMIQNSTVYSNAAILSRYAIYEAPDVEGSNGEAANVIGPVGTGTTYFAPQLVDPAENQAVAAGTAFAYQVAPGSFVDGDDGIFALTAKQASGAALPSWLTFNPATGQFSGIPTAEGTYQIVVQARDAQGLKDTTTFELVVVGGSAGTNIFGTAGDDTLVGSAGPENLFGLAGHDILIGGGGDDRLDGGSGADALYGEDGDDYLVGGTSFHTDILVAGAGNDVLFGISGQADPEQDLMDGGAGNDTYYVDTGVDLTFEAVGGGTDTVYANVPVAGAGVYLYANVENLVLEGTTAFGVGNELDNVLTGSASSNWLLGDDGNDTINGGGGNDVLFGDRANGPSGMDIFVFEQGTGGDVIGDFQQGIDKIMLVGFYADFAALQSHLIADTPGDANVISAIDLGAGDFIVLHHVDAINLTANDFIFG